MAHSTAAGYTDASIDSIFDYRKFAEEASPLPTAQFAAVHHPVPEHELEAPNLYEDDRSSLPLFHPGTQPATGLDNFPYNMPEGDILADEYGGVLYSEPEETHNLHHVPDGIDDSFGPAPAPYLTLGTDVPWSHSLPQPCITFPARNQNQSGGSHSSGSRHTLHHPAIDSFYTIQMPHPTPALDVSTTTPPAATKISQQIYKNRSSSQSDAELPFIVVNARVRDALRPETLEIAEPLAPAFLDPFGKRDGQKYTSRFVFEGPKRSSHRPVRQRNEYTTGRSSKSVKATLVRQGRRMQWKLKRGVISRIELVEWIVVDLQEHMRCLKEDGHPLMLNGREVDCEHLLIVGIRRPTPATVQPTLQVLPEYVDHYHGARFIP